MFRRGLQRALQPLVRSLQTSVAPVSQEAVEASSKVAPALEGAASRLVVPLTKPLPGFGAATQYIGPLSAPPTKITTLANGLRIVSEASTVGRWLHGA